MRSILVLGLSLLLLIHYGHADQLWQPVGYDFNVVNEQYPTIAIDLTFNQGNSYNGIPYPDQYFIRQSDLSAELTSVTDIMLSVSAYYFQMTQTSKTKFGLGIPGIASINFAYSKTQTELDEMFKAGMNACMQQTIMLPVVQIDLESSAFLDPNDPLILAFGFLPPSCTSTSDQRKYQLFIEGAGTHLVAKVFKGGLSTYMSCVNKNFMTKYGSETTSEQFGLSIKVFNIKFGLDTSDNLQMIENAMNAEFVASQITDMEFFGGFNLTSSNYEGKWVSWSNSVRSNLTSMSVLPYNEVLNPLSGYLLNDTKSVCLQNAIVNYINTGNLNTQFEPAKVETLR